MERAWLVTETGAAVELEAGGEGAPPVAPTFAPVGRERSMTTRAAASAVDRRQRTMQEVEVVKEASFTTHTGGERAARTCALKAEAWPHAPVACKAECAPC